ncbi:MAG: response regulator [Bacteroidales bacterium]|nr:response regulator [Bacteroidales bacterium]
MKPTILVMEDEKIIRMYLEKALAGSFVVVMKANGAEGLEWLEEGNIPSAVITDLNMPVIDGFGFLEKVRASENYKDLPVVVLSAMESTEEKTRCFSLGATEYLSKPLNISILISSIERLIASKI